LSIATRLPFQVLAELDERTLETYVDVLDEMSEGD
jgi:hypothetical protein